MHFTYPQSLPITNMRKEIVETLKNNQVVIIAGDTGSGKTTQLPKMCLELQEKTGGKIGCTQPRRIAAMTVSARVAEELDDHSNLVGYTIRFQDHTDKRTRIKFMTDGILLAEARRDKLLRQYDILIIDEAHERSLNIDFLLGHIKNIISRRKDLKIIVTSATIDTEAFAKHFNNAPVVTIPGKTYPVDVRYVPPREDEYGELENYVESSVTALSQLFDQEHADDALLFLPTEKDITTCCNLLRKKFQNFDILPLFGRLHSAEQKKIFKPGKRTKIVVATNVAETSVTVPGIRYVVDTGLARMAYYNYRAKTHSLPIQKISRASCDQRKGRCGRIGPGICIRLFEEEDYLGRDDYTIPEIKRSNLAEVVLQMLSFKLGDPFSFPFIDPPLPSAINEGYNQLLELGAIRPNRTLTAIGKQMAVLPIDPSISRIVIEAKNNNCLKEVMIIATVLAIQDPRVRPPRYEQQADEAHKQFIDDRSDFLTFLNIWNLFHTVKAATSWSRLKKFCNSHFLSFQRMREWIDLHQQMTTILQSQSNFALNSKNASYEAIHKSLAVGFLRNIALKKEGKIYTGSAGKEIMIFPGSGQFTSGSQWIIGSSFMETNRLYALNVASINPEWLEKLAGKLCKYSWSNPRYNKKLAQVVAEEKVTLFGLPIVQGRRVNYGRTSKSNKEEARIIFIQSALMEGQLTGNYDFLNHNQNLFRRWQDIENRLRTKDILISESILFSFYDENLPGSVHDRYSLNRFLKKSQSQSALFLTEEDIVDRKPEGHELADFPPSLNLGNHKFTLQYIFDPTREDDGVSVRIPLSLVESLKSEPFDWLVPGLIKEKTTFLLKSLPKRIRKHLIPLNSTVDRILDDIEMYKGSYFTAIESSIYKYFRIHIRKTEWSQEIPKHLQMRFLLIDSKGKELFNSRDFSLIASYTHHQPEQSAQPARIIKNEEIGKWQTLLTRTWEFDHLPANISLYTEHGEHSGFLYPAIIPVPEKSGVTIDFLEKQTDALKQNRAGMRYLYRLTFSDHYKALKKYCKTSFSGPSSLWLIHLSLDKTSALESLLDFILDTLFGTADGKIHTKKVFDGNIEQISRDGFFNRGKIICDEVMALLRMRREVIEEIERHEQLALQTKNHAKERYDEYREHLQEIIPEDFLEKLHFASFQHCKRYMKGLIIRISRAHSDLQKDQKKAAELTPYLHNLRVLRNKGNKHSQWCTSKIAEYETMIHEMRISLFAPELKTAVPVSSKKMKTIWQQIVDQC